MALRVEINRTRDGLWVGASEVEEGIRDASQVCALSIWIYGIAKP